MDIIKKQLRHGIFFTAIGQYAGVVSNFFISIVLSRILGPSVYGVLNIMLVLLPFFQLITSLGVGPAIVQNKELNDRDYSSLFKILFAISLVAFVLFGALGIPFALIYRNPIYYQLSWFLAPLVLLSIVSIVPVAILQKRQDFKKLNFTGLFAYIIGGILGIAAAFGGWGIYALVISNLLPSLINFIFYFYFSGLKLLKGYDRGSFTKIRSFSGYQMVFGIFNYFAGNMDNLVIGKFFGQKDLGNYGKSFQLVVYPNNMFAGVIVPVMQPVLSNFESDIDTIKKIYHRVINVLMIAGIPLSVYLFANADLIIEFLFGPKWSGAIFPFRILALTTWIHMTTSTLGAIYQARNKTKELMNIGFFEFAITAIFIVFGVFTKSINGMALMMTIHYYIIFWVSFGYLSRRVLDDKLRSYIIMIFKPLVASLIGYLSMFVPQIFGLDLRSVFWQLLLNSMLFWFFTIIPLFFMGEIKNLYHLFK
ncbi:lipopolysaccharide biosynthesis protein [Oenococcus sp.]|uniref:lipopolysaccharide biosynthesis protein n=1 Tax=Oenococcus sp. TaxID=1979414 RepID=UPI0039E91263